MMTSFKKLESDLDDKIKTYDTKLQNLKHSKKSLEQQHSKYTTKLQNTTTQLTEITKAIESSCHEQRRLKFDLHLQRHQKECTIGDDLFLDKNDDNNYYFQIIRITNHTLIDRFKEIRTGILYCYDTYANVKQFVSKLPTEVDETYPVRYEIALLYIENEHQSDDPDFSLFYSYCCDANCKFSSKSPWNTYKYIKYGYYPKYSTTDCVRKNFCNEIETLTGWHLGHYPWDAIQIELVDIKNFDTTNNYLLTCQPDESRYIYDHYPINGFTHPLELYCKACNDYFIEKHEICNNCKQCLGNHRQTSHQKVVGFVNDIAGGYDQIVYTCQQTGKWVTKTKQVWVPD